MPGMPMPDAGKVMDETDKGLLDPTCSRGLWDSDLFGPYKLLTIWLAMILVATIAAFLV